MLDDEDDLYSEETITTKDPIDSDITLLTVEFICAEFIANLRPHGYTAT